MKRLIITSLAATVMALPTSAQIGAKPSNDTLKAGMLYSACTHPPGETPEAHDFAEQTCVAYFRGLTDALFFMQLSAEKRQMTCMPANTAISNEEARNIFVVWLKAHPETTTNSAGTVAAFSILDAYRCKK